GRQRHRYAFDGVFIDTTRKARGVQSAVSARGYLYLGARSAGAALCLESWLWE
ncbi:hypothetical protein QTP70_008529, partial [Hemibagrus guttatus]